ncbi:efflux RND transporter periplasmic adaptor subunit [Kaistia algarum]|uniref:efflux RND transporter periplasmic adaptor subunit n=1 Tax=Kaistia algarum TaxID=2083279 RepID=UPI000CE7AD06|nr:efflux RND transporter periplasmic adaptor subunit [Kaistia algarum]MCX5512520.1 efflux RND transporter periplasmic adaptor subunit [Kaistia algarum]PPE81949.1 efflux RND transporter periplasmic adaptor subunit [Kaistia algarum]
MRKRVLIGVGSLLLILGAGAAYFHFSIPPSGTALAQEAPSGGGGKGGRHAGGGAAPVKVATATTGDLPVRRSTIGWIQSKAATTITTQQTGIVTSIAVANGQEVKTGDLILQFDDRAAEATLARDHAALARDQTTVVSTTADLQRVQDLVKRQVDSAQQLDVSTAAAASAKAVISLDEANIAADQVVVDEMKIRAPHAGRLGAVAVTVGSLVQPGSAIVTLTDVDNIEAVFTVSDADAGLLRASLAEGAVPVHVRSADSGGAGAPALDATVDFIDSTIVQGSGTMAARASLANDKRLFWPGEAVNIDVDLSVHRGIVLVPSVAVQQGQNGPEIFVVKADGTIDVRNVEVAGIVGDQAGIAKGLAKGEQVVTEGQLSLTAGQKVTVRDASGGSGGDPASKKSRPGAGTATENAS